MFWLVPDGHPPGVREQLLARRCVRPADVAQGRHRQPRIGDPRRDDSLHVAAEEQHHRLVEGQHHRVDPAEHLGAGPRVPPERTHALRQVPRRLPVEPGRVGEVMERHHRPEAHVGHRHQPAAISVEDRVVEPTALRLDARPLEAHPKGGRAQIAREPVVLAPAVPVVHAGAGDVLHPSRRAPTRSSRSRCCPSTWYAAVATPKTKSSGKRGGGAFIASEKRRP